MIECGCCGSNFLHAALRGVLVMLHHHMQRSALIQTFHSEIPASVKLASYVNDIRSYMKISYASLSLVSTALWLQCSVTSTMSQAAPDLPSAPDLLDQYSVARQLQEVALEDPLASLSEYSLDDDLPSDIEALAKSRVRSCSQCAQGRSIF